MTCHFQKSWLKNAKYAGWLTEVPEMVPFLSDALVQEMKSLLNIFIKEDVIQEASSALKVSRIDVENEENYLDLSKIKVSTALKEILREVDVSTRK